MATIIQFADIVARRKASKQQPVMHPFFKNLASQKRVCPRCLKRPIKVEPKGPNIAKETCTCSYIRILTLPAGIKPLPDPEGDAIQRARTQVPIERQAIEPYIPEDEWRRMQAAKAASSADSILLSKETC